MIEISKFWYFTIIINVKNNKKEKVAQELN